MACRIVVISRPPVGQCHDAGCRWNTWPIRLINGPTDWRSIQRRAGYRQHAAVHAVGIELIVTSTRVLVAFRRLFHGYMAVTSRNADTTL